MEKNVVTSYVSDVGYVETEPPIKSYRERYETHIPFDSFLDELADTARSEYDTIEQEQAKEKEMERAAHRDARAFYKVLGIFTLGGAILGGLIAAKSKDYSMLTSILAGGLCGAIVGTPVGGAAYKHIEFSKQTGKAGEEYRDYCKSLNARFTPEGRWIGDGDNADLTVEQ